MLPVFGVEALVKDMEKTLEVVQNSFQGYLRNVGFFEGLKLGDSSDLNWILIALPLEQNSNTQVGGCSL